MANHSDVIIIGAGLGGLSTAAHLSNKGYKVTIIEREAGPGGRMGVLRSKGYTFDTGPTVMTMTDILESVFNAAGSTMSDFVQLEQLDPTYRGCFADGSTIRVRSNHDAMLDEIRNTSGAGEAASFERFCAWLGELYKAEMPNFINRNFDSVADMARPLGPIIKLLRLGAMRRLGSIVESYFKDERLQKLFSFQAMYAGVAPHQALGVYAVITYMDTVRGVYTARGGMTSVANGLATAVKKSGVDIIYDTSVVEITRSASGSANGVRLSDGSTWESNRIVCNLDLPIAYRALLPKVEMPRRVANGHYSPSALVWHVGTRGSVADDVAHHNIHFGNEWKESFDSLFKSGERMTDPSLLVTVPTVSDDSLAPSNCSSLYVLEPVPNLDANIDWRTEHEIAREQLAKRVAGFGYPLDVETEYLVDPLDWQHQGMERGTPFALSHRFFQSGPFRAKNIEKEVPGLVFVGSSTVPGVGVPMVLLSGRLAAERVMKVKT